MFNEFLMIVGQERRQGVLDAGRPQGVYSSWGVQRCKMLRAGCGWQPPDVGECAVIGEGREPGDVGLRWHQEPQL